MMRTRLHVSCSEPRRFAGGLLSVALAAGAVTLSVVLGASDGRTPAYAGAVENPGITIRPATADLDLCEGKDCGEAVLQVELDQAITSPEPKCAGFPNFQDPATCPRQTLGAFSFRLQFDPKLIQVGVEPAGLGAGTGVTCMSLPAPGRLDFGCMTKGKPADAPSGPGLLAVIRVTAAPDLRELLAGVGSDEATAQLLTMNCHLADLQGHAIASGACDDATIVIRTEHDSDKDGCSDDKEKGADPRFGGQRDINNFWDFFDTPAGGSLARNKTVTVEDIVAVASRFGSSGSAGLDPLSTPLPAPSYHTAYDRTDDPASLEGWRLLGPDGRISVTDIMSVVGQFGHNCRA